jgi:hypothetical protein
MGLGLLHTVDLKEARQAARDRRQTSNFDTYVRRYSVTSCRDRVRNGNRWQSDLGVREDNGGCNAYASLYFGRAARIGFSK